MELVIAQADFYMQLTFKSFREDKKIQYTFEESILYLLHSEAVSGVINEEQATLPLQTHAWPSQ